MRTNVKKRRVQCIDAGICGYDDCIHGAKEAHDESSMCRDFECAVRNVRVYCVPVKECSANAVDDYFKRLGGN